MKKNILILALLGLAFGSQAQITTGEDIAVVSTDNGKVRGYVHQGIYTYKGICGGSAL